MILLLDFDQSKIRMELRAGIDQDNRYPKCYLPKSGCHNPHNMTICLDNNVLIKNFIQYGVTDFYYWAKNSILILN